MAKNKRKNKGRGMNGQEVVELLHEMLSDADSSEKLEGNFTEYDRESVYTNYVLPKIEEILAICETFQIPFIAIGCIARNLQRSSFAMSYISPRATTPPQIPALAFVIEPHLNERHPGDSDN